MSENGDPVDAPDRQRATDDGPAPEGSAARSLGPLLGLGEDRHDLDEVARLSGIDAEQLRDYWRALGFPDPRPGDRLFSDDDVEMLSSVVQVPSVIESPKATIAPAVVVDWTSMAFNHHVAVSVAVNGVRASCPLLSPAPK